MKTVKNNGQIISRLFRKSVISIILAAIATMVGIVIDGIVIGRFLGPESMAAYGLVTPVINLATAFSGILATGAQVICAQHLGAGNVRKARRVFSMCMLITVILSFVMVAVMLIFRDPISVMLGAHGNSANLLKPTSDYILGIVASFPCVLFLFEFNSLMRLDGDANRVIVAVVVMTVLDVAGDLVNALVIHGGMLGMGLTTSLSYFAALVIMLLHFTKKDIIFKFSFKGLRIKDMAEIFATGSSSAVGSASSMLRNLVLNQIMVATLLSGTAVAALGVVNTVFNFTSSTMLGVAMTTAMIAGMILGEQDRTAADCRRGAERYPACFCRLHRRRLRRRGRSSDGVARDKRSAHLRSEHYPLRIQRRFYQLYSGNAPNGDFGFVLLLCQLPVHRFAGSGTFRIARY